MFGLLSRRISEPRSLLAEAPHLLLRRRLRIRRTLISFPTDGFASLFRFRAHNHVPRSPALWVFPLAPNGKVLIIRRFMDVEESFLSPIQRL